MGRLLLLRHGQSEWNALGRWQGRGDPPLSDLGRVQAAAAGRALQGFMGTLASSTLRRAIETAEIIGARLGIEVSATIDDLSEVDIGDWTGHTTAEIDERWPGMRQALRGGEAIQHPGGEHRTAFRERVLGVLPSLCHPDHDTLAITHGGVIHTIERHLDVHPDEPLANLSGRWFEVTDGLRAVGHRVALGG